MGDLKEYFGACKHNLDATDELLPVCAREFDSLVSKCCHSLAHPTHIHSAQLVLQMHSSLRSALVLTKIGSSQAVIPVIRHAIECGAIAYLIRFDEEFARAWSSENPSSKQKDIRRKWSGRLKKRLSSNDPRLQKLLMGNYEDSIALGAHPSLLGLQVNSYTSNETTDGMVDLSLRFLGTDFDRKWGYFYFCNACLIFSEIWEAIWPERAKVLNLQEVRMRTTFEYMKWVESSLPDEAPSN